MVERIVLACDVPGGAHSGEARRWLITLEHSGQTTQVDLCTSHEVQLQDLMKLGAPADLPRSPRKRQTMEITPLRTTPQTARLKRK